MAQNEKKPQEEKLSWRQNVMLYLHDFVYLIVTVMLVLTLFFRVIAVSGPSMKMTLLDGDYLLLVSNLFYRNPKAGDVVVISKQSYDKGKPLVKRIIATEGQIVDMDFENGFVYVDGLPLEETYVNTPTNRDEGMRFPLIVEEGTVFVLGDNRNNSHDSRAPDIGLVDTRELVGRVVFLMYPGTDFGSSPRDFGRIGAVK